MIDGWQSDGIAEDASGLAAVSLLSRSLASLQTQYPNEAHHSDHKTRGGTTQREQLIIPIGGDKGENWDWLCRPKRQVAEKKKDADSLVDEEGSVPDEFRTYAGARQSPIIIQSANAKPWRFPPLKFHHHWNRQASIQLTNTGHSVQMSFGADNKINGNSGAMPYLSGGPLHAEYEFVQMHFHWGCDDHVGCEHVIDDKRYAMEAHLVHYNRSYGSVEEAFKHRDGLSVVGVFLEVGKENKDLEMLATRVPDVCSEKGNCTMLEEQRPLRWVKEAVQDHFAKSASGNGGYFSYLGSLTTPGYDENVIWILFPDPVQVSPKQIAEFRQLMSPKGRIVENFREIQPIASRNIYRAE